MTLKHLLKVFLLNNDVIIACLSLPTLEWCNSRVWWIMGEGGRVSRLLRAVISAHAALVHDFIMFLQCCSVYVFCLAGCGPAENGATLKGFEQNNERISFVMQIGYIQRSDLSRNFSNQ